MSDKLYIHYGHPRFEKDEFHTIENRPAFSKPFGGLWASPVDAELGWKQWCMNESFALNCFDSNFTFRLSENSKVLHIRSVRDLELLPVQKEFDFLERMVCPDFEKLVSDGWDAIELHLSEENVEGFGWLDGLYWYLYGWDCDSILVMNPDVVEVV